MLNAPDASDVLLSTSCVATFLSVTAASVTAAPERSWTIPSMLLARLASAGVVSIVDGTVAATTAADVGSADAARRTASLSADDDVLSRCWAAAEPENTTATDKAPAIISRLGQLNLPFAKSVIVSLS